MRAARTSFAPCTWLALSGLLLGTLLLASPVSLANAATDAATEPLAALEPSVGDRNLRLSPQPLGSGGSQLPITDVLQDAVGFVWVGTEDGLFRLGGSAITAFSHSRSDPRTLADDGVTALHTDDQGQLWVATRHGLHRYDPDTETFERQYPNGSEALQEASLTAVLQDAAGRLWVGTEDSGLFALADGNTQHFTAASTQAPSTAAAALEAAAHGQLPSNRITALHSDRNGNLWIGTDGGGLARFDRRTQRFVSYRRSNSQISSNRVTRIYEDPKGTLWIGTQDAGLDQFEPDLQSFTNFHHAADNPGSLSSNHVTDMLTDHNGSFWIATTNGLNELETNGQFARYAGGSGSTTGLRSNDIRRLHQDADGVLWIATDRGLDRWNYLSDAFRYPGHAGLEHRVSAATECPDGQLWLGTRSQGIAYLERDSARLQWVPGGGQEIRAMLCDPQGTVWIGTADAGLQQLQPDIAADALTIEPALPGNDSLHITSLVRSQNGTLWAGTASQGLLALVPAVSSAPDASLDSSANSPAARTVMRILHQPEQPDSLPDDRIETLFLDKDERLWITTASGMLAYRNPPDAEGAAAPATFTSFALSTDNGRRPATDLLQSMNGDLWITTNGGGLLRWPAEQQARGETRFTHFTKASGLPSDHLRAILEDQAGKLWISTTRGLVRFDPNTLKMRQFDRDSGLRGDRFFSAAKLASRSGQLFFGGQQGLTGFYPSAIGQLKSEPRITLSAHSRSERLLRTFSGRQTDAAVELKAGTAFIEFRFGALQFVDPEQNHYQYQLEGFDARWYQPNRSLTATYTGLPAGHYTFRVKAANPDGVWNNDGAAIALHIAAPWWQTASAYVLYTLLLVAALAYLLFSWRREVERLRSSRRNLEIQVEHRTTELEERNRQLQELNLKLQEASITDPLTGLLNRRSFYEFVSREVARVERSYTHSGSDLTNAAPLLDDPNRRLLFFMMIDLDAFKPINDTFGHHTGDHTLVQVSDLLRDCARDADTVFRWGGDEFLVIGQVQNEKDMELLAERFRKTISEHRFDPKYGKALRLSASIGVAPYPFCAANPGIAAWEQVADVADLAAYLAKTHGKNAWVCTRGSDDLTAMQMQRVKDNFELLIETRKIIASSSETHIPIPGASRTD